MNNKGWALLTAGVIAAGGITGGILSGGGGEVRAGVIEDTIGGMSLEDLAGSTSAKPPSTPPTIDAAKVRAVVADLIEPEKWNGTLGIARKHKLSLAQVKEINRARLARIRELTPVEEEVVP